MTCLTCRKAIQKHVRRLTHAGGRRRISASDLGRTKLWRSYAIFNDLDLIIIDETTRWHKGGHQFRVTE